MNAVTKWNWFGALSIAASCLTAAVPASAASTVINFDDVAVNPTLSLLPNGYSGLDWSNWGVTAISRAGIGGSGYEAAAQGSPNVAFNWSGLEASFGKAGGFVLESFDIAAAWNNNLNVTVTGLLGGTVVGSQTFSVSTDAPTTVSFNWSTVDLVRLSTSGGVHNDNLLGSGTHVGLDNLSINSPIPEPHTYALLLLGLTGIAVAARKRA